ncbi:hypothetical protein [Spirosoma koreense]
MKSILTVGLVAGLLACQAKQEPEPGIRPADFVGTYQFTGSLTYSQATEGYLQSPSSQSGNVSGQLQIKPFGTGTAIQILESSLESEVNKHYQASPATQQMVPIYVADKSEFYADMTGRIYLINDKEISLTRTQTTKYGNTYYTTELSLRGVRK